MYYDLDNLSDSEPNVLNIILPDKLPPCSSESEQHTRRNTRPFLPSVPCQYKGGTDDENYPKRVSLHTQTVSGDTAADNPAELHDELFVDPVRSGIAFLKPTLDHHQATSELLNGGDLLDELYSEHRESEVHQMKVIDHQLTSETSAQPPSSLREFGDCAFSHSEERDSDPLPSYMVHTNEGPVDVAGELFEPSGESLMNMVSDKFTV